MDPFLAQIIMFAGSFAPRGWAFCNGQLLPISQHTTLFSILGTTYGGDGRATFALPDFRSRVPVQHGQGPGLHAYRIGQRGGAESHIMTTSELPKHQHGFSQPCGDDVPDPSTQSDSPENKVLMQSPSEIYGGPQAGTFMSPGITEYFGNSQAFSIQQPYVATNFIIALQGSYPSR